MDGMKQSMVHSLSSFKSYWACMSCRENASVLIRPQFKQKSTTYIESPVQLEAFLLTH